MIYLNHGATFILDDLVVVFIVVVIIIVVFIVLDVIIVVLIVVVIITIIVIKQTHIILILMTHLLFIPSEDLCLVMKPWAATSPDSSAPLKRKIKSETRSDFLKIIIRATWQKLE